MHNLWQRLYRYELNFLQFLEGGSSESFKFIVNCIPGFRALISKTEPAMICSYSINIISVSLFLYYDYAPSPIASDIEYFC